MGIAEYKTMKYFHASTKSQKLQKVPCYTNPYILRFDALRGKIDIHLQTRDMLNKS